MSGEVNIPEFLKVYNRYKVDGPRGIKEAIAAVQSEGTPADCIACGSCTGHCPQSDRRPDRYGRDGGG